MINDILVILMVAFGLFAVSMFVLFYAYLKKQYNNKHLSDDYENDIDDVSNQDALDNNLLTSNQEDDEFIPKKKM